jgi:hypothetical protein
MDAGPVRLCCAIGLRLLRDHTAKRLSHLGVLLYLSREPAEMAFHVFQCVLDHER